MTATIVISVDTAGELLAKMQELADMIRREAKGDMECGNVKIHEEGFDEISSFFFYQVT
jgi:hypothetical protein